MLQKQPIQVKEAYWLKIKIVQASQFIKRREREQEETKFVYRVIWHETSLLCPLKDLKSGLFPFN